MKWKTPNGFSPSNLEFKVTISKDGKSSYQFCKKLAKKLLFVHHQSVIPKKSKINFAQNEWKCIKEILTTKHENAFNGILCLNSYPENNINQTNQRDSWSNNTEWSYLKIPYISEQVKSHDYQYFSEGQASQYELLKAQLHPQMSLLPQHCWAYMHQGEVPHLLHQFMQFTPSTRSHVLTAINYTLVELFISSTIVLENNLSNKNSSVKKHISICLYQRLFKRYWNQDHHTRKRPHKFTNILHKKHILFHMYLIAFTWNIFLYPWWHCWSVKAWIFYSSYQ